MKKNLVKLNPQESDGVTRRGRGTRGEPKFNVGDRVKCHMKSCYWEKRLGTIASRRYYNGFWIYSLRESGIDHVEHHLRPVEPQP